MTKIDIFSGFLGAGKTTLIKKLIGKAYAGEKLVLIENEFGEIGIDGGFLKEAGIEITEMNSGCICCSLVGDFGEALKKVLKEYSPDRIIIEPSGVGKLSDVIKAVEGIHAADAQLNGFATVVDVNKCKMYMKNFGEFFNDQIENSGCIILSHTQSTTEDKLSEAVELIKSHNDKAIIITTPWDSLDGKQILEGIERKSTIDNAIEELEHEHNHEHDQHCDCGCHEHQHEHDEHCDCDCHEHNHEHDQHCDCGCHEHQHEHDEHCDCDCHEHNHEHAEHCDCGCHEHQHHHADDVFASWGKETTKKFTKNEIENALRALEDEEKYGTILRAKGIVANADDDKWIHFDYIPGEADIREGSADITGRLCVIGANITTMAIEELLLKQ
ncbi:MAG: GTP-binding protein [Eubacteriales bacterium]|nr:GTP-binding protein [Eubacteriales bacterium]